MLEHQKRTQGCQLSWCRQEVTVDWKQQESLPVLVQRTQSQVKMTCTRSLELVHHMQQLVPEPRIRSKVVVPLETRQTFQTFQSRGSKARQLVRLGPRERTVEQRGEWQPERPS